MAEATGLRNNALNYPIYGAAYGVVVPIFDADGDLVSGATTPDSEVSKNGDTFADCTNEATEIATNSGMYYLLLTAAEMTADVVAVIVKSATTGAKTTPVVLYPKKLVTVRDSTATGGAAGYITLDAGAAAIDDYYNGMVVQINAGTGDGQVRVISDYTGSNKQAAVSPGWATSPANDSDFLIMLPDGVQTPQVNVVQISGDATAADNAESFFDGTGYAGTNNVIPTVTGITNMVSANVTQISGDATAADNCELMFDGTGYAGGTIKLSVDLTARTVEGSLDELEVLKVLLAALAGKASGGGTSTIKFRDQADGKDRITATVDANGNRTAITLDAS